MNKLICLFLFIVVNCRAQIKSDNDYQNMSDVIDENIKKTVYYEILKENNIQTKFYITNLSSDEKETIKSKSLKNGLLLKDGFYAFYIKDIRYSFTHIYVKSNGKIKIFQSINCPPDNIKIKEAITYIKDNFGNKGSLVDDISNYSKYIQYSKIDPQSKFNCQTQ
ncbi:hypothetical protein ACM46_14985 [Chryseobacterium angstadtii]|uniref:Uncharacterized protein n=1 Tax=Chryseobacterium angstadtii TaxID=558151 RepID=A0A0J7I5X9_9FLAO|nr:hypothetical protein [Chryseobacterium angstadtii]KMQ61339.1 hypothetical protein ACM46_14985 [Chryseobacterium angstadtii]